MKNNDIIIRNNDIIIRREEEKDHRETESIVYLDDPDADYFLVKELKPGFLSGKTGVYTDPELYFVADKNPEEFEQFDRTFPEKQKLKLPGQLF